MTRRNYGISIYGRIQDHEHRVLVLRRSSNSRFCANKWEFPGGKLELGEALDEALRREIREETGLDGEIASLLGLSEFRWRGRRIACIVAEVEAVPGKVTLSREHSEFRWVNPTELDPHDVCPHCRPFLIR